MYSVLGIDWNEAITNTPSGRAFQDVEPVSGTTFLDVGEIESLFVSTADQSRAEYCPR
jgi:hypothetical protein